LNVLFLFSILFKERYKNIRPLRSPHAHARSDQGPGFHQALPGPRPRLAKIAEGLSTTSRGSMHKQVQALAAGVIRLVPDRQRGIELVEDMAGVDTRPDSLPRHSVTRFMAGPRVAFRKMGDYGLVAGLRMNEINRRASVAVTMPRKYACPFSSLLNESDCPFHMLEHAFMINLAVLSGCKQSLSGEISRELIDCHGNGIRLNNGGLW
jgi:hypothetical protein